ncbi:MAG TPA: oxidoreductase [Lachnospiraceae bacterium]|nr:oxidoreductase [Lachnospiraceae bacterium]
MRQTYRILPVYTGDVSGVCSALYELGGMTVMHDPSGCNSTYNTHDETRWYDRDSLIFLSGLCEPDAVLGNDEKLIEDVVSAAESCSPLFISLCNSPIPYLTGTDFAGISRVIEQKTGIPTFYVPTNGMHDYVTGAGLAFSMLARKLFGESEGAVRRERTVNVLGMTPLDFGSPKSAESIRELLAEEGWKAGSVWAMGSSLGQIKNSGSASVNLVVSAAGLGAAKVLREKFGTPWVCGMPAGGQMKSLSRELERAEAEDLCGCAYIREEGQDKEREEAPDLIVIGEPVSACSIAGLCEAQGMKTKVIASTEGSEGLIRSGDLICRGEEEAEDALSKLCRKGTKVIADPLYRYVLPPEAELVPLAHLAFSGRLYRSRFTDPFDRDFTDKLFRGIGSEK